MLKIPGTKDPGSPSFREFWKGGERGRLALRQLLPPLHSRKTRQGFTIIEMLVVVFIILVLMSLLLPALQRVREAYSMGKCANNLRNIGMAMTDYAKANPQQYYPTGGGDVDLSISPPNPRTYGLATAVNLKGNNVVGSERNQDWGWAYQILRQMEGDAVYNNANDAEVRSLAKA